VTLYSLTVVGKLQDEENKNEPFSLFVCRKRRQALLASMMLTDATNKVEGERILNNYKRQLAERVAREKIENGKFGARDPNESATSTQMFMEERLKIYDSSEIPDPAVLEAILARESKFERISREQ
jgi:hypothetical protein